MSLGKYKNGTLYFSKDALARLDKGDLLGGAYKSAGIVQPTEVKIGQEKIERKKHTYKEILEKRETNPDYMTGKRHKKARGSMGKLHKKGQKPKKRFKKK